jgi:hypothetical protein
MNSEDAFVELHVSPAKPLALRASAHILRLAEAGDLWYAGGGAFSETSFGFIGRPSGGGKDLARLVDLSVDYEVSPRLGLTLYAGRAVGREVVGSVYPDGKNGTYAYLEVLRRF